MLPLEAIAITKNERPAYKYLTSFESLNFSAHIIIHGKKENAKISGLKTILCVIEIGKKFKNIRVDNAEVVLYLNFFKRM